MTKYYVALTDKQAEYYDSNWDDGNRDSGVLHRDARFSSINPSLDKDQQDEPQTVYVVDSLNTGFDRFKQEFSKLKLRLVESLPFNADILNLQTALADPSRFSIILPASPAKAGWLQQMFPNNATVEAGFFTNPQKPDKVTLTFDKNNLSDDEVTALITLYHAAKADPSSERNHTGGEIMADHGIDFYNLYRFAAEIKAEHESEVQAIEQQRTEAERLEAEQGFSLGQTLGSGFGLLSSLKEYTAGVMVDPETSTIGYGTAWTGGAVTSLAQALLGFGGTLAGTVVAIIPGETCNQDAANLWHGLTNFSFGLVGWAYVPFMDSAGETFAERESAWWEHTKTNVLGYDPSNPNAGDRWATSTGTVAAIFVGGKVLKGPMGKVNGAVASGVRNVAGKLKPKSKPTPPPAIEPVPVPAEPPPAPPQPAPVPEAVSEPAPSKGPTRLGDGEPPVVKEWFKEGDRVAPEEGPPVPEKEVVKKPLPPPADATPKPVLPAEIEQFYNGSLPPERFNVVDRFLSDCRSRGFPSDKVAEINALEEQAKLTRNIGDPETAIRKFEEAASLAEEIGDTARTAELQAEAHKLMPDLGGDLITEEPSLLDPPDPLGVTAEEIAAVRAARNPSPPPPLQETVLPEPVVTGEALPSASISSGMITVTRGWIRLRKDWVEVQIDPETATVYYSHNGIKIPLTDMRRVYLSPHGRIIGLVQKEGLYTETLPPPPPSDSFPVRGKLRKPVEKEMDLDGPDAPPLEPDLARIPDKAHLIRGQFVVDNDGNILGLLSRRIPGAYQQFVTIRKGEIVRFKEKYHYVEGTRLKPLPKKPSAQGMKYQAGEEPRQFYLDETSRRVVAEQVDGRPIRIEKNPLTLFIDGKRFHVDPFTGHYYPARSTSLSELALELPLEPRPKPQTPPVETKVFSHPSYDQALLQMVEWQRTIDEAVATGTPLPTEQGLGILAGLEEFSNGHLGSLPIAEQHPFLQRIRDLESGVNAVAE